MSKSLQYLKVLSALQTAGGPLSVEAVRAIPDIVPSRLSTYLWEIKKHTTFAVRSVRNGRAVVAYELVGSGSVPTTPAAPVVSKPKASKPAKSKQTNTVQMPVAVEDVPVVVDNDPIVDSTPAKMVASSSDVLNVLDEIDTNVVSYEDRSYAESYVKML